MSDTPAPRSEGTRIGPYILKQRLGVGALTETYRADRQNQPDWSVTVALKLLHPHLRRDPELRQAWVAGCKAWGDLSHPDIVQLYEIDERGDDLFAGTELVWGTDLARLFRRCGERPLPLPVVVALGQALTNAVTFAHDPREKLGVASGTRRSGDLSPSGIALVSHGRLTPDKVLFSHDGRVKVNGFGLFAARRRLEATTPGGSAHPSVGATTPFESHLLTADIAAAGKMVLQAAAGTSTSQVHSADLPPALLQLLRRMTESQATLQWPDVKSLGLAWAQIEGRASESYMAMWIKEP